MNKTFSALASVALVALVGLAGCGGSDNGNSASSGGIYGSGNEPAKSTSPESASGPAAVSVADTPNLGKVIVDSQGFTLYDFHKDKGTTSSCYGGCASVWPPLLTSGAPNASGAQASKLGTTRRKDGATQVTYAGHPLYTYTADAKPGDTKGNDIDTFGGEWYALQPSGEEAGG